MFPSNSEFHWLFQNLKFSEDIKWTLHNLCTRSHSVAFHENLRINIAIFKMYTVDVFIRSHVAVWVIWTHNAKCAFRGADNLSPHEQLPQFSFLFFPPSWHCGVVYKTPYGKMPEAGLHHSIMWFAAEFYWLQLPCYYTRTHLQIKCSIILH